jgi:hypothetical protein
MPLKAISAKSMCCTVVGPTRTLFPPPVPLPPLSFSSHDLGALVGMSGWPALWIQATRGRIYRPRPRIRAGGGCQPPSPRGVGSPVRSSPSYCKRVLVQATPGETTSMLWASIAAADLPQRSSMPCLAPPIGHRMGSGSRGLSPAVPPSPHPPASRISHAPTHRRRAPWPMGGSLIVTLLQPMGWV